jgi:hypothetical protein
VENRIEIAKSYRKKKGETKQSKDFRKTRDTINTMFLKEPYSSLVSGRSQSGLTLTLPRAFSSMMRCSIDATSFLVNPAISGLIETESIPALTKNPETRAYYLQFFQ